MGERDGSGSFVSEGTRPRPAKEREATDSPQPDRIESSGSPFNPIQLLKDSSSILSKPADLLKGLAPAEKLLSGAFAAKLPEENKKAEAGGKGIVLDAGTRAVADRVLSKLGDSPDPVADVTSALKNLDNLKGATVERRPDGKHKVEVELEHASYLPPVNIQMRGFHPGPTLVGDHVGFVVSQGQRGTLVEDMHGFSGSVSRRRTLATETTSMLLTKDTAGQPCVVTESDVFLRRRVMHNATTLHENNFAPDSPMRHLMHQPDALKNVASALSLFQNTDDLGKLGIKKIAEGKFDVGAQAVANKHVEINQKLQGSALTVKAIDLDKSLSASFSYDKKGVNLDGIKGMNLAVTTPLGDIAVVPRKVALQTDKSGKPSVQVDFEDPNNKGSNITFAVPMSTLIEQGRKGIRQ